MDLSWITLYPEWYIQEREALAKEYPSFKIDERALGNGKLILYGELVIHPPKGTQRYPVRLEYPSAAPYEYPIVTPIQALPEWDEDGGIKREPQPKFFSYRHQMPSGGICAFHRQARNNNDILKGVDVLQRAKEWFLGHHTNHWPPDTALSDLEAHFASAGNVLIEKTFFEQESPGEFGRLFFVWDFHRMENPESNLSTLILTSLTKENNIIKYVDARKELTRLYPWIRDITWDAIKLAATPDLGSDNNNFLHGYWWSLPMEPSPFRDGKGLLEVLKSIAKEGDAWTTINENLGSEITKADHHLIGLKYPARDGGVEWLILFIGRGERKKTPSGVILISTEHEKRKSFETSQIAVLRVHKLEPANLRLRNMGVISDSITSKTVAMIGLGALGSKVAELLSQAGVGHFRICDVDDLCIGNVARHIGGVNDFGASKTSVIKKRLLQINPYLEFGERDVITSSITGSFQKIVEFIEPADLTICTTADENVESAINQAAVIAKKAVLYGRSIQRASMGRVFIVRPGIDACKDCLSNYVSLSRAGEGTPSDWIDLPEDDEGIILQECGRPIIASSAIDLSFTASLIARVALDYLQGRANDKNHWIWTREPKQAFDSRLSAPMSTFIGQVPRYNDCTICREPNIAKILLAKKAYDNMVSELEKSSDVETGGILIGYVDDEQQAIVIKATGPGPESVRTHTAFHRDVEYVQSELNEARADFGARGQYLGEWHSHLEKEPAPSSTDINSLVGIARAPHYLTRCPIMIIIGNDPASEKIEKIHSSVFSVGGRVYPIPYEINEIK